MRVGHPATSDWPTPDRHSNMKQHLHLPEMLCSRHSLTLGWFFSCDWTRGFSAVCHTIKARGVGPGVMIDLQPPAVFPVRSAHTVLSPSERPATYLPAML